MFGSGEDGEHNGVGFVEMSRCAVQDDFFYGAAPLIRVYSQILYLLPQLQVLASMSQLSSS